MKQVIDLEMRRLMDSGRLVESGWMTYRRLAIPPHAPPIQLRECRLAFWHGASFLFQSLMHAMEPGTDETPADLRRVAKLHEELDRFEQLVRGQFSGASQPKYTCPRCGATSHNANDITEQYCGVCHDWTV